MKMQLWDTQILVERRDTRTILQRYTDYLEQVWNTDIAVFEHEIRTWETTSEAGYWMTAHNHGQSQLTSIHYTHIDGMGGDLIIQDPRANANRGWPQELAQQFQPMVVQPEPGMTVTFPSYCYHLVSPFYGTVRAAHVSELQLWSLTEGQDTLGATAV
jgi:hypothetical protein